MEKKPFGNDSQVDNSSEEVYESSQHPQRRRKSRTKKMPKDKSKKKGMDWNVISSDEEHEFAQHPRRRAKSLCKKETNPKSVADDALEDHKTTGHNSYVVESKAGDSNAPETKNDDRNNQGLDQVDGNNNLTNASTGPSRSYRSTLSNKLSFFEELAQPHTVLTKLPERIEVVMGDIIDAATFCMVQKSELDSIKPMEDVLTEQAPKLEKRGCDELLVGKWIAAYSREDKMWFRATIAAFYNTYKDGTVVDAYLLDHGLTLKGIKYPDNVRNLPPAYKRMQPYAFQFKLHGLVPQNLQPSAHKPLGVPNKWPDITSTVAHLAMESYEKAQIFVDSRDSKGRPMSGRLVLELNHKKIGAFRKYRDFLEQGGFTDKLPNINFNTAYVNSKLAKFVRHDGLNELHPSFTASVNFELREKETRNPRLEPVDQISIEVRRRDLLKELDDIIKSDDNAYETFSQRY